MSENENKEAKETEEAEEPEVETGQDENTQLKEIIDGTARIGQSIGEALRGMVDVFSGRDYVVMVRVNKLSLDKIDQLVESGLFRSRSESAAFLIAQGAKSSDALYGKIEDKVIKINNLKEELRELLELKQEKSE